MTNDPALADKISLALGATLQRFDRAHAEWLAARADYAIDHPDDTEEDNQARYERQRAAEMALIATPAPTSTAIWTKWAILEASLTKEAETGQFAYPLPILALAALKADILALGLKPWLDA